MEKTKTLQDVYIITQNKNRDVFFGDIVIENNRIKHIVLKENDNGYGMTRIAIPAFHNLHMHLGETIFRGQCEGMDLFEYLDVSHLTYEKQHWKENEDRIHRLSGYVSFMESIKNGCSIFACGRGWDEAKEVGIKSFCLFPIVNIEKLEKYYHGIDQILTWDDSDSTKKVKNSIFLQSIYLADESKIDLIAEYMKGNPNLKLFIHVAETKKEIVYVREKYGCTPVEFLDRKGLLNNRIFCVHCVHLTEHDYDLLSKNKANVILCPISNLKLKSGYPNIRKMHEYGINLLVSPDGFATNNSASVLEELKLIGLTTHGKLSPYELLDMLTVNPAKTISQEKNAGEISVGAIADISIFEAPGYLVYDKSKIVNHLIYNFTEFHCNAVFVDGEVIYENAKFTKIDQEQILKEFCDLVRELFGGIL